MSWADNKGNGKYSEGVVYEVCSRYAALAWSLDYGTLYIYKSVMADDNEWPLRLGDWVRFKGEHPRRVLYRGCKANATQVALMEAKVPIELGRRNGLELRVTVVVGAVCCNDDNWPGTGLAWNEHIGCVLLPPEVKEAAELKLRAGDALVVVAARIRDSTKTPLTRIGFRATFIVGRAQDGFTWPRNLIECDDALLRYSDPLKANFVFLSADGMKVHASVASYHSNTTDLVSEARKHRRFRVVAAVPLFGFAEGQAIYWAPFDTASRQPTPSSAEMAVASNDEQRCETHNSFGSDIMPDSPTLPFSQSITFGAVTPLEQSRRAPLLSGSLQTGRGGSALTAFGRARAASNSSVNGSAGVTLDSSSIADHLPVSVRVRPPDWKKCSATVEADAQTQTNEEGADVETTAAEEECGRLRALLQRVVDNKDVFAALAHADASLLHQIWADQQNKPV